MHIQEFLINLIKEPNSIFAHFIYLFIYFKVFTQFSVVGRNSQYAKNVSSVNFLILFLRCLFLLKNILRINQIILQGFRKAIDWMRRKTRKNILFLLCCQKNTISIFFILFPSIKTLFQINIIQCYSFQKKFNSSIIKSKIFEHLFFIIAKISVKKVTFILSCT